MSTPATPDILASPCVRNCCLGDDNVCLGCGRLLEEILSWGDASDEEKREILDRSRLRVAQRHKPWQWP